MIATPTAQPAVQLDQLIVAYGQHRVLDSVSLRVEAGECMAVLGSNGAGKSTLLKALLGLVHPAGGSIRVLGQQPRRGRVDVGYCPQMRRFDIRIPLRARDLVGLGLDGHRWGWTWSSRQRRDLIDRALEDVQASHLADQPVSRLSGGEQQRLAIAQALLSRPRLLLLDEPLASLDVASQRSVVQLVDRLRRELSMAVLFVTHGLNPLLGVIDRVCYLAGGRAAVGTVDQVIRTDVLSTLYGAPIEVVRVGSRIFVATDDEDAHD